MDVQINGPRIIAEFPFFGTTIRLTETVVVTWVIMAVIIGLIYFLTRNLKKVPTKRQWFAEMYVGFINNWVKESMGEQGMHFAPYIGTVFLMSLFMNYSSLFGFRPPTADFNTVVGWALITFFLIQKAKLRNGIKNYFKGFLEPIPVMLPMNIISELSTPLSLSFRHFGNLLGGTVITTLVYAGLAALSSAIINIGIPFMQLGIPAVLSLYFDIFTGFIQAYIFCTLTMVFVSMEMDEE